MFLALAVAELPLRTRTTASQLQLMPSDELFLSLSYVQNW